MLTGGTQSPLSYAPAVGSGLMTVILGVFMLRASGVELAAQPH
jgi:hypothetical protein